MLRPPHARLRPRLRTCSPAAIHASRGPPTRCPGGPFIAAASACCAPARGAPDPRRSCPRVRRPVRHAHTHRGDGPIRAIASSRKRVQAVGRAQVRATGQHGDSGSARARGCPHGRAPQGNVPQHCNSSPDGEADAASRPHARGSPWRHALADRRVAPRRPRRHHEMEPGRRSAATRCRAADPGAGRCEDARSTKGCEHQARDLRHQVDGTQGNVDAAPRVAAPDPRNHHQALLIRPSGNRHRRAIWDAGSSHRGGHGSLGGVEGHSSYVDVRLPRGRPAVEGCGCPAPVRRRSVTDRSARRLLAC